MGKNIYSEVTAPVVIVDDEPEIADLIESSVRDLGLLAISYSDPIEAAKKIPTVEPCLVLSDYKMDDLTGTELYQKLKADMPNLSFVLVTAFADKDLALESLKLGVSEILEKPFGEESLVALVRKYVDRYIKDIERAQQESMELVQSFIEEAEEQLEDLPNLLLRLEDAPIDGVLIDLIFRKVHSVKGGSGVLNNAGKFHDLAHAFETTLSMIRSGQLTSDDVDVDLFLSTHDLLLEGIKLIKEGMALDGVYGANIDACIKALQQLSRGEAREPTGQPLAQQVKVESVAEDDKGVFVVNEKLDQFMKISGDLIVTKNAFQVLCHDTHVLSDRKRLLKYLMEFQQNLGKITDQLQDQIMDVRKIKLEQTFSKLPRLVRQVSKEVEKRVKLQLEGVELGVDKAVAKALSTCMTHIIRNSIDHGIEGPEERLKLGKSPEGHLMVSASEEQGIVKIKVTDDGRGVQVEKVVQRAIDRGIVDSNRATELSDEEVYELLFEPGFSTTEKVTSVSGRGVGMDAVKSEIVGLHGTIQISSTRGSGTEIDISIPIPKTVMVEDSVIARDLGVYLAIPLSCILHISSVNELSLSLVDNFQVCQFQGQSVQVLRFSELVEAPQERKDVFRSGNVVFIHHKKSLIGLYVDSIEDQLEAVVRPFSNLVVGMKGFKGTTLIGDDGIAYVVSAEDFVAESLKHQIVDKGPLLAGA